MDDLIFNSHVLKYLIRKKQNEYKLENKLIDILLDLNGFILKFDGNYKENSRISSILYSSLKDNLSHWLEFNIDKLANFSYSFANDKFYNYCLDKSIEELFYYLIRLELLQITFLYTERLTELPYDSLSMEDQLMISNLNQDCNVVFYVELLDKVEKNFLRMNKIERDNVNYNLNIFNPYKNHSKENQCLKDNNKDVKYKREIKNDIHNKFANDERNQLYRIGINKANYNINASNKPLSIRQSNKNRAILLNKENINSDKGEQNNQQNSNFNHTNINRATEYRKNFFNDNLRNTIKSFLSQIKNDLKERKTIYNVTKQSYMDLINNYVSKIEQNNSKLNKILTKSNAMESHYNKIKKFWELLNNQKDFSLNQLLKRYFELDERGYLTDKDVMFGLRVLNLRPYENDAILVRKFLENNDIFDAKISSIVKDEVEKFYYTDFCAITKSYLTKMFEEIIYFKREMNNVSDRS